MKQDPDWGLITGRCNSRTEGESQVTECTVRKDLCGSICVGLCYEVVGRSVES